MPQATYGDPHDDPPYKRYPAEREYFAAQVEETLFPRPTEQPAHNGRWLRRPVSWFVALGPKSEATFELAVDLLEIVRVRLQPYVAFGIAHLSLTVAATADDTFLCGQVLSTRFRESTEDRPLFAVYAGSNRTVLTGNSPLHPLTAHLFGAAHENVALRAYIFAAAQAGASVPDDELPAWRRALGQGQALSRDPAALERFTERDRKRTERFGPTAAGSFFGRSAALTFRQDPSGSLRNLRSYWSEAILFALIQHAYIEGYAQRLSRLGGEPLGEPVEDLFVQWLAFRNVLWWRSPSFTTPVAGEILQHAHHGLRTERLFAELETGFATYIEQRRHRAEDLEAKTLRRLQVYGAIFAVVSTFAALMQVAGESYLKTSHDRLIAVGGLVAFGIVVLIAATLWLARRDRKGG